MALRIISGRFRGRRLHAVQSPELRPTTDRVREALMSAVGSVVDLRDSLVLDLFAGTGALGLEALSRGAKGATFVEANRHHFSCLKQNLKLLDLNNEANAICQRVEQFLSDYEPVSGSVFDIIFADPPYDLPRAAALAKEILDRRMLTTRGVLVWEGPNTLNFGSGSGLTERVVREKRYGKTMVWFLR